MKNVSLGNMVCRLQQINGVYVYVAYFEVFVHWWMFTSVSQRIISWFVVVFFTLWVEIVEYKCVYSLWHTGLSVSHWSLCMPQGIDTLIFNDLHSQSEKYYNKSRNYSLRYGRKHPPVNKYFKICNINKHTIYLLKSTHHIPKRNILHQFKNNVLIQLSFTK